MKKLLLLALCLFLASLQVQAQTAREILDQLSNTLNIPSIQGTVKVSLISQNGDTREIEARVYQKQVSEAQSNRLFLFDFPPTVRGTGLLLHSFTDDRVNNMWIYLPTVKRIKRIALESSGGGYFMGSDFTYRDLLTNDYSDFEIERLADTVIDGHDCYVVKAWGKTPEIRQDHGYAHIITYYQKKNFVIQRRDYFDFNEDLLKVYAITDYLEFGENIYPTRITMKNVQTNHSSIITVENVTTEDISDQMFTTRYLQSNR